MIEGLGDLEIKFESYNHGITKSQNSSNLQLGDSN